MNQVNNELEKDVVEYKEALENQEAQSSEKEYKEIMEDGSNINQENVSEELNKILPSSGFDFAFDKFQKTLDEAKEALDMKLDNISKEETQEEKKTTQVESLSIEDLLGEAKQNSMKRLQARVEAILFLSEKPRTAESIAQQCNTDADLIRQALSNLVQDYEDRDGGVVIDCTHGYCMQIADEFEDLTEDILPIELRTAVLRTLSTIALKEPMLQKDLMQIRGGGIYEHVKELVSLGLVKKTKEGNSHIIHTTKFFSENFKLSQNGLELQTVLKKASPKDVEFVRPNTLIAGHEYEVEEDTEKAEETSSEASDHASLDV
jgi:segregation and condensation protein B